MEINNSITMTIPEPNIRRPRSFLAPWKRFLAFAEIKLAFKTGLAASVSLALGLIFAEFFDRPDILVSGLWCVLASIVVMQANLGGTYNSAWIRFLGVFVGSIAGAIFINTIGSDTISLGISVFCTIVICAVLGLKESFRIAGLSTAIIIILGSHHPTISPWLFSLYRFVDSCIGILVALFVSRFIWPAKAVEDIKRNIAKILNLLGGYYLTATSLETEPSSLSQTVTTYFNDIDDLLQENRENRKAAELELFDDPLKMEHWTLLSDQLEVIFESINSVYNANKETLSKIFDDGLAKASQDLIDQTAAALKSMEAAILTDNNKVNFDNLKASMDGVAMELARFRSTRTTRKFNIQDVESFYFYFYSLRTIAETTLKIKKNEV